MNKGLLTLNLVLLAAVAVLFFLFFSRGGKNSDPVIKNAATDTTRSSADFRIAYFDMDSIEAHFGLFKQMQREVTKKEDSMNTVLNSAKMNLQSRYQKIQEQRSTMSPEQLDQAGKELSQMDINIRNMEASMNQSYQSYYMNKQQEMITLIKKYLLEFNSDGKYSYIIANEPGLVYYKDTACNITSALVKGLNEYYDKHKKN